MDSWNWFPSQSGFGKTWTQLSNLVNYLLIEQPFPNWEGPYWNALGNLRAGPICAGIAGIITPRDSGPTFYFACRPTTVICISTFNLALMGIFQVGDETLHQDIFKLQLFHGISFSSIYRVE